jgi:tellurite methyltransferase
MSADASVPSLSEWLGDIDIYLLDQLMRGRITPRMRILDAGCGGGRNLLYFLRAGYEVAGTDQSPAVIQATLQLARQHAPGLPRENFRVEPVERMSFAAESFLLVISSAVVHMAPV